MRIQVAEHIKSAVIDAWLRGKTRVNIASEFNTSTGSVSNIVEQWQNRIGVFDANNLRMLGLALKKAGIITVQCVDSLITNIIKQLDIDEDNLFDFLNKLYNERKEQRLLPGDLVRLVQVIKGLSSNKLLKRNTKKYR
jgi:hypothetical protein